MKGKRKRKKIEENKIKIYNSHDLLSYKEENKNQIEEAKEKEK